MKNELLNNKDIVINEKEKEALLNNKDDIKEIDEEFLSKVNAGYGGLDAYTDSGDAPKYNFSDKVYCYKWFIHEVTIVGINYKKEKMSNWCGRDSYQYKYLIKYNNGYMDKMYGYEWVWECELSKTDTERDNEWN